MHRKTEQVMKYHETEKKNKHHGPCTLQRRDFIPVVVSVDGILGEETKTLLKQLAGKISKKTQRPYSQVRCYVNARMSIAICRATHLCIRGSRVPMSMMSYRRPQWEDGAGLELW